MTLVPRRFAAGLVATPFLSDRMAYFVTGGQNHQSSEILYGKVWSNFQQTPAPSIIYKSCIVSTESEALLLIGGNQGNGN
jgi:hypothetical protein